MEKTQHIRGVSRRRLLETGGGFAVAGGLSSIPGVAGAVWLGRDKGKGANLTFVNGKIHTMDGSNRIVSQLSIRDGRFAEVGSGSGSRGSDVKVIDLRGKTVIPGIIDSHTHIVVVGNRPGYHVILDNVFTIKDVVERYKQVSRDVPPGNFITTIGPVTAMQFPEQRLPNLSELDAVDRPVYIQSCQPFGAMVTNSLGKAWFNARGITNIADDGTVKDPNTLLLLRQEQLDDASRRRTSRDALQYYSALGVTTQLDAGGSHSDTPKNFMGAENRFSMYNSFLALDRDGALPARLRVNFLYNDQDPDSASLSARLNNAFPFFGSDMFKTGGIGEFVAPLPTEPISLVQAGFPPVANNADNTRWLYAAMKVAKAGWRLECHSADTTDFRAEIEGYALVNQQFPITSLRWVIAHVPYITRDYVDKLKALGGGVKVGAGGPITSLTEGYVRKMAPFRMILDSGIHAGYHSDGGNGAIINPWPNFYAITTGRNLRGELVNEGQTLTRQQTLWLATVANKWFIGEDDIGSIEVGNHADLVVLDRDYFDVPEEQIPHISSLLTVVGGNVVHDAGTL